MRGGVIVGKWHVMWSKKGIFATFLCLWRLAVDMTGDKYNGGQNVTTLVASAGHALTHLQLTHMSLFDPRCLARLLTAVKPTLRVSLSLTLSITPAK